MVISIKTLENLNFVKALADEVAIFIFHLLNGSDEQLIFEASKIKNVKMIPRALVADFERLILNILKVVGV